MKSAIIINENGQQELIDASIVDENMKKKDNTFICPKCSLPVLQHIKSYNSRYGPVNAHFKTKTGMAHEEGCEMQPDLATSKDKDGNNILKFPIFYKQNSNRLTSERKDLVKPKDTNYNSPSKYFLNKLLNVIKNNESLSIGKEVFTYEQFIENYFYVFGNFESITDTFGYKIFIGKIKEHVYNPKYMEVNLSYHHTTPRIIIDLDDKYQEEDLVAVLIMTNEQNVLKKVPTNEGGYYSKLLEFKEKKYKIALVEENIYKKVLAILR